MVCPSSNLSDVSSQSTRPSFRAMNPSGLATMWIVTRDSMLAMLPRPVTIAPRAAPHSQVHLRAGSGVGYSLNVKGYHDIAGDGGSKVLEQVAEKQVRIADGLAG